MRAYNNGVGVQRARLAPVVRRNIIHGFAIVNDRPITAAEFSSLTIDEARGYVTAARQAEPVTARKTRFGKRPKIIGLGAATVVGVFAIFGGTLALRHDDTTRNVSSVSQAQKTELKSAAHDTTNAESAAGVTANSAESAPASSPAVTVSSSSSGVSATAKKVPAAVVTPTPVVPAPTPAAPPVSTADDSQTTVTPSVSDESNVAQTPVETPATDNPPTAPTCEMGVEPTDASCVKQ